MNNSNIEWTDMTWNPFVGCSKVSPGCQNCYAEKFAWRLANNPKLPAETRAKYQRVVRDGKWTGEIEFFPERLEEPLRARKPRRIFVGSMGDLFHPRVKVVGSMGDRFHPELKDERLKDKVFAVMALCQQHQFLVLTKRPEGMREYLTEQVCLESRATTIAREAEHIGGIIWDARGNDCWNYWPNSRATAKDVANRRVFPGWPLPNVWLSVTVENQEQADKRIPELLEIPAAKRFVSIEPMLGPVDLRSINYDGGMTEIDALSGTHGVYRPHKGKCESLDQIIVGGETGPGARPMHPDWPRKVRDDCEAAGVPLFFKSWGDWAPSWGGGDHLVYLDGSVIKNYHEHPDAGKIAEPVWRIGKKRAGHLLDGKEYRGYPE